MDDYKEVDIAREVQDARIQTDVEIELNECTIPELGTLANHTRMCEMVRDRAHRQGKAKHRRRN